MLRGKTVLIVDDEVGRDCDAQRAFGGYGARLIPVSDGQTAISVASTATPDLIIMEVRLRGLHRLKVAARILAARRVPIVFYSADDVREEARVLGCEYVDKATPAALIAVVARVLASMVTGAPSW